MPYVLLFVDVMKTSNFAAILFQIVYFIYNMNYNTEPESHTDIYIALKSCTSLVTYFDSLHYYGNITSLGFTPKRFTVEFPFRYLFVFKVLTRLMYPHFSDELERRSPR